MCVCVHVCVCKGTSGGRCCRQMTMNTCFCYMVSSQSNKEEGLYKVFLYMKGYYPTSFMVVMATYRTHTFSE